MKTPYEELIQQVEAFGPEAAEYLRTDARQLEGFSDSSKLDQCFVWEYTPQGHDYWDNICFKLYGGFENDAGLIFILTCNSLLGD